MNIKKGIMVAATAAIGAGLGSITTALIMTRQCHNMMEYNKEENEEIRKELENLKADVKKADKAFNTYKEKVEFCDKEAKEMHTAIIEGFRNLAQEGKTYQQDLRNVSKASIDLMKKELKDMLNRAEADINNKKQDILVSITEKITEDSNNKNNDNNDDDITKKMIDQIETDTGKTTKKKGAKK